MDPYPDHDDEPRITFSAIELLHLFGAVVVLTVAFSFAIGETSILLNPPIRWERIAAILPFAFLIVITSFMLHEFAHKVSAQMYHMWAEFRASLTGLLTALGIGIGAGFVLAAPGAVVIYGDANERESGIISIVGPAVNLVLGFAALPFTFLDQRIVPLYAGSQWDLFSLVVFVNVFLAAFNMLPVWPLDGSKIWRWSKLAYLGMAALTLALLVLYLFGTGAL